MSIYVDTGDGYPSGTALAAARVAGVIGYVGTPGRRKNLTAAVVADYRAHGIAILAVYEDIANDVAGGRGAGSAHAQASLTDMHALGLPTSTPVCAAADEHLTAGMIPTATAYQAGFYDTVKAASWSGPCGGYGFSEFLAAIRAATKADWGWQAGAHPGGGSTVNLWQRNGSNGAPTQMTIGGITVDIDDLLIPIQEVDVQLTDPVINPTTGKTLDSVGNVLFWTNYYANQIPAVTAQNAGLVAAVQQLATNPAVTAEQIQQYIDQAVAQHVAITGTVQIGPAPTPAAATPPAVISN